MSSGKPRPHHAIMIALPYQGHINPFVDLALKIASRGFLVTFVHLHHIHQRLSKNLRASPGTEPDFFYQARLSGLDIRYMTISDGFPVELDRELHILQYWRWLRFEFPALVDAFIGELIGSSDPCLNHFLVADTVFAWPAPIAQKYNLVNVSFWTQPALVFSLCYHWDALIGKGHVPRNDDEEDVEIDYIPGIKSISTKDLMSFLKEGKGVVAEGLVAVFVNVKKADFILHNVVDELESETLSILNSYQPNYAIGPISFSRGLPTNAVSKSLWLESDCTQWLDSKSPGSVLYVSFGSLVLVSKEVIEEIAYGLLLSEVEFIWVAREGIVGHGLLPDGYEEEIIDRGLIVPWCNQIRVLSNPAIGGFLTHCGWNSILESMWCGVPMLCLPVTYDQPTNKKLVVDDWKTGINLCEGLVDRKRVAETIKRFISEDRSKMLRHETDIVKKTLQKALDNDGSSETNFDQFVKELKKKLNSSRNQ